MDYEKAYKDLIEKLRTARNGQFSSEDRFCVVIDNLVPGLEESEDERIRKALIHLINEQDGFLTAVNGISVKDIIAWLEKQKIIADNLKAAGIDVRQDGSIERHTIPYLEKQKEQKPAECIEDSVKFEEGFKTGREVGFREGVESVKPAEWSEEDEKALNSVLSSTKTVLTESNRKWLTSLPERFNLQPKPEWNNIDELKLQTIEAVITRQNGSAAFGGFLPEELIDFLKSLRPLKNVYDGPWVSFTEKKDAAEEYAIQTARYPVKEPEYLADLEDAFISGVEWKEKISWKPSEEQMRCLEDCVKKGRDIYNVCNMYTSRYDAYPTLKSLYNELSKL